MASTPVPTVRTRKSWPARDRESPQQIRWLSSTIRTDRGSISSSKQATCRWEDKLRSCRLVRFSREIGDARLEIGLIAVDDFANSLDPPGHFPKTVRGGDSMRGAWGYPQGDLRIPPNGRRMSVLLFCKCSIHNGITCCSFRACSMHLGFPPENRCGLSPPWEFARSKKRREEYACHRNDSSHDNSVDSPIQPTRPDQPKGGQDAQILSSSGNPLAACDDRLRGGRRGRRPGRHQRRRQGNDLRHGQGWRRGRHRGCLGPYRSGNP